MEFSHSKATTNSSECTIPCVFSFIENILCAVLQFLIDLIQWQLPRSPDRCVEVGLLSEEDGR